MIDDIDSDNESEVSVAKPGEQFDRGKWGGLYDTEDEDTPSDYQSVVSTDDEGFRTRGAEIKAQADQLFKSGQTRQALQAYTLALRDQPTDPTLLNNRSLCYHRLGLFREALADGEQAMHELTDDADAAVDDAWKQLLAKTFYRQAAALMSLQKVKEAVAACRKGLKVAPCETGLTGLLRKGLERVHTPATLAALWAGQIVDAETPAALSTRDGKLLKPVWPEDARLGRAELTECLQNVFQGREYETRDALAGCYARGKKLLRHLVAGYRAWAYLEAENPAQALKDANLAVAWSKTKANQDGWERAHFLLALALERCDQEVSGMHSIELAPIGQDGRKYALHCSATTAGVISMRRAFELNPDCEEFVTELKRMVKKLPDDQRKVLLTEGADGLVDYLEEEKWKNAPEALRPRPKYFYYYEWMKDRIYEHFPELPGPVMDKLLMTDASELDLLLQYPQAIKGQVEEYLDVYRREGGKYLQTYRTPVMTWDEVKAMKGAGTTGLGIGYHAPGEGHLGGEKNTNHALVGGGGDGRLTETERAGLPAPTTLPPDMLRDRDHVVAATEQHNQKLLEGKFKAEGGRQAAIMASAQNAAVEAANARKFLEAKVMEQSGDLDGID